GPHSFYWILLQPQTEAEASGAATPPARNVAEIRGEEAWEHLFTRSGTRRLEAALRQDLEQSASREHRRPPRAVRLRESFRVPYADTAAYLAIVDVEYAEWTPETLAIPIAFASSAEVAGWATGAEPPVIARIEGPHAGVLLSAYFVPAFCETLLQIISRRKTVPGSDGGELVVWPGAAFDRLREPAADSLSSSRGTLPQTNTSIQFGNRLVLKVYRRIEDGTHPEPEIGRFLTDVSPFEFVAPFAASVEYRSRRSEPMTLAVLHGFVPNEGDAWQYTLDLLSVFFERVATISPPPPDRPPPLRLRLNEHEAPPPPLASELLHGFLDMIRLLGRRLAELHRALAGDRSHATFAPEPFSLQYQRAMYQSMRNLLFDVLYDLERVAAKLPPDVAARAGEIPLFQGNILRELHSIVTSRVRAERIHRHGDCQLHQILFTGKDFIFIDFEGRPTLSVGERWIKTSPLRDVVTLLRSFDYAAHATLFGLASGRGRATGVVRNEDRQALLPWLRVWRTWVHDSLLAGYLETCAGDALLPASVEERNLLFRVLLLDKLLSEIDVELATRPAWLDVPLTGLLEAVKPESAS
ncbi:MAG TPA: hypothetical protein VL475_01565, partial [Planctomycetaceae bacterium]|nr:hypothetical protein [Planctomycetaceae bacterium]